MDPNAPQFTPAQSPVATSQPLAGPGAVRMRDRKLIWGLICLIGPSALLVLTLLAYALTNFIVSSTAGPATGDAMFNAPSIGTKIVNIILFLVGAITVLTWLPGLIAGIILLATRKK